MFFDFFHLSKFKLEQLFHQQILGFRSSISCYLFSTYLTVDWWKCFSNSSWLAASLLWRPHTWCHSGRGRVGTSRDCVACCRRLGIVAPRGVRKAKIYRTLSWAGRGTTAGNKNSERGRKNQTWANITFRWNTPRNRFVF